MSRTPILLANRKRRTSDKEQKTVSIDFWLSPYSARELSLSRLVSALRSSDMRRCGESHNADFSVDGGTRRRLITGFEAGTAVSYADVLVLTLILVKGMRSDDVGGEVVCDGQEVRRRRKRIVEMHTRCRSLLRRQKASEHGLERTHEEAASHFAHSTHDPFALSCHSSCALPCCCVDVRLPRCCCTDGKSIWKLFFLADSPHFAAVSKPLFLILD